MPAASRDHPARFGTRLPDGRIQCGLCPHGCSLGDGQTGQCHVRSNRGGRLVADTYGLCSSISVDPMEKKPLYHYYPGRTILSVGGWGCNLHCRYCQNAEISQSVEVGRRLPPEELIALAKRNPANVGLCFTYNEPLIAYEYVFDTAQLARAAGLHTVLVTNGYINPEPLRELAPLIDAANVDLKSASDEFYADLCGGRVAPVQESLRILRTTTHIEVTKLLVTGHTDPVEDADLVAAWVASELGRDVPLHLSRYFPRHRWPEPETPTHVLMEAFRLASRYLDYVYVGNATADEGSDTRCPGCQAVLIERDSSYRTRVVGLGPNATCGRCGRGVPIRGAEGQ